MSKVKVEVKEYRKKRLFGRLVWSWKWFFLYLFMIILVVITSLPLVYMITTAFKPLDELYLYPPRFYAKNPTFDNFYELFTTLDSQVIPFTRYIFNSVLTTGASVFLTVIVASMGAYSVDKIVFPGRNIIFKVIISALMFSPPASQIPVYLAVSKMGMLDTYWALIIPGVATPMYFFLLKQFFSQIPYETIEAARIDGASEFKIFYSVAIPMGKAAISTVIVFSFIANWNNSSGSTIYITNQAMKTLPYALGTISSGGLGRAGAAAAAVLLTTLPTVLVYLFMQNRVLSTMTYSGIKG